MIRVLYIDDEASMLALGTAYLPRLGKFEVETAVSGESALEKIAAANFDVIVSDYRMTGMDGIELLKEVRKTSNVPFILFTGKGREEVAIQAIDNGADFYLQKGDNADAMYAELAHKILAATGRRRMQEALLQSEQRLFDIINFLPDATFAIDREGRVIAWNHAIEEMTGVPAPSILGKGGYQYALPFYGEPVPLLIDLVVTPGAVIGPPRYHVIRRDGHCLEAETGEVTVGGRKRVLYVKATPLYDKDGGINGAIESIRDITSQKEAQEALAASEERYRTLIETTVTGFAVLDENGVVWDANNEYAYLTGYRSREDVLGKAILDWTAPYDHESTLVAFKGLLETGKLRHYEADFRWPDGTVHPVEVNATTLVSGGKTLAIGIIRDISLRREAEAALRRREQLFRGIVETSRGLVTVIDRSGSCIYISPNVRKFTGYGPEEVMDVTHWCVHPDDLPRVRETFRHAIVVREGGQDLEFRALHRDGRIWLASSSWEVLKGKNGTPDGLVIQTFDVTEPRKTEKEMRESREMYRTLVEHSQDGVFIIQDGRVLFSNNAFAATVGYTVDEITGIDIARLIAPENREMVMDRYRRRMKGEKIEDHYDFLMLCRDGSRRVPVTMDVGLIPCRGAVASMGTIRDITRQRAAREMLDLTVRKLHLMSSIIRQDISRQVTGLQQITGRMREGDGPGGRDRHLDEADTILGQIRRSIDFTAIYECLGESGPEWQDLAAVARGAAMAPSGVPVEVDVPHVEVLGDAMLGRAFLTLVENTGLHADGATRGRFLAEERGDGFIIIYEDDGCGVLPGEKERIFERDTGGHGGFGLFLAREILGITGISIRETGVAGHGARFEMAVPAGYWRVRSGNNE